MIKNPVTDVIAERKSVRVYKKEQISAEQLETVLESGFLAPSGSNCQNWHVVVIQSKDFIDRVSKKHAAVTLSNPNLPERMRARVSDPNYSFCFGAPTVMFIAYEPAVSGEVNAAFLTENMVLAAQSVGLGTCFLGGIMNFFRSDDGKEFIEEMGLPEGFEVMYGLAIGTPDEKPEAKPRDFGRVTYIR